MNSRLMRALPYIVLLAVTVYFYHLATIIQSNVQAAAASTGRVGPDFWPRVILVLLGATCIYEIVKNLLFSKPFAAEGVLETFMETAEGVEPGQHAAAPQEEPSYPGILIGGIGITILYVVAIRYLGFFIATSVYMALFMYLGRYRRLGVIAATSLLGTLALMFVFLRVVYVSLPIGVGPFAKVSSMIMQLMGVK